MIGVTTYLGSARVTKTGPESVLVALPSGESASARLALAVPYAPEVGDEVLVISQDGEEYFAIGLLHGAGKTRLKVSGDLEIEARSVSISAEREVRIHAPTVEAAGSDVRIRAGRFDVVARRILEKANDVYAWVAGLFQLKSQRVRTVAEDSMHLKSRRAYIKADADVNIDGESIHLG